MEKNPVEIFNELKTHIPLSLNIKTQAKMKGEESSYDNVPVDADTVDSNTIMLRNTDMLNQVHYNAHTDEVVLFAINSMSKSTDEIAVKNRHALDTSFLFDRPDDKDYQQYKKYAENVLNYGLNYYEKTLNNKGVDFITDKEKILGEKFVIAHEMGHAVFFKYNKGLTFDTDNIDILKGKFNETEKDGIQKVFALIESTSNRKYTGESTDLTPSLLQSKRREIEADTFATYLLIKEELDKNNPNPLNHDNLGDFFVKMQSIRNSNNILNSGQFRNTTHDTENVFNSENLLLIENAAKKGNNIQIQDLNKIVDKVFIQTLQENGILLIQRDTPQPKTVKEALYNEYRERYDLSVKVIKSAQEDCINGVEIDAAHCKKVDETLSLFNNEGILFENNQSGLFNKRDLDSFDKMVDMLNIPVTTLNEDYQPKYLNQSLKP